jgi:hypothetical protein
LADDNARAQTRQHALLAGGVIVVEKLLEERV